jgi:hypothetical protein
MRVLLDECVPRALRNDIPGHDVKTVAEMGWAGVKNGELLRRANDIAVLRPLMPAVLAAILQASPGVMLQIRG